MLDSLDFEGLRRIGLRDLQQRQWEAADVPPEAKLLRVTELQREHLLLHDGHDECRGRLAKALVHELAVDDDSVAVGDWVVALPDAPLGWRVVDRLPPATRLARRVNDGRGSPRRQVLVSNVDMALLVMGLDHDFNVRRLERYLALVRLAGVEAMLVLTKADLVDVAQAARRELQATEAMPPGMAVVVVDGRAPGTADVLAPWLLPGRTLVLLGSSGAGKSTLTNTLMRSIRQDTGPVRRGDDRGRHTTTARTLHLTPEGACIIDTPGLRALRLDVGDDGELQAVFGDVAQWAARCRFRDCRHQAEPGCAVREAVAPERLRNFQKLQREARRDTLTALERREQVAQWKARGRQADIRMRAKRSG
ncbi:MAG TPA: ribosome small subunit-dependent GTPase A [Aquabacterium sp.]|nr:ribosome small subunit-dependent GTPase A [Aquabacterium sp.]